MLLFSIHVKYSKFVIDIADETRSPQTCCKMLAVWFTLHYHTIALISHASKVMLKILQVRLQQYVNRELPVVQAGLGGSGLISNIDDKFWILNMNTE